MVHAVGYDRDTRTLEVVFNDGGIYLYQDVPRGVYHGLLRAPSKGQFMQREVLPFYTALPLARVPVRRAGALAAPTPRR
jgi:hypothetical protein